MNVTTVHGSDTWESNFPQTEEIGPGKWTWEQTYDLSGGRYVELYEGTTTNGEYWSRYEVAEDACQDYESEG